MIWCLGTQSIMEGRHFGPEYYAPIPHPNDNGYPIWENVNQYNQRYLQSHGTIEKTMDDYEPLSPVKLWMKDRWTFVRRIFGDELIQKTFMKCSS